MKNWLFPRRVMLAGISIFMLSFLSGCSGSGKTGDAETFADWIKAYTGEFITGTSTIKVDFTKPIGAEEAFAQTPEEYISFSPSIDGKASWTADGSRLVFVPEVGALKPGHKYTATVRLDKLYPGSAEKFVFRFTVAEKQAGMKIEKVLTGLDGGSLAMVIGHITLSEPVDGISTDMITVTGDEECTTEIQPVDGCNYDFFINGISRVDADKTICVGFDATGLGFKEKLSENVEIPGATNFKVLTATNFDGDEPYVLIQFSDPLLASQNLNGLVTLSNTSKTYFDVDSNLLKVYYDRGKEKDIKLTVLTSVKSYDGRRLSDEYAATFRTGEIKPLVRIPLEGSILPDPNKMILPFRSVNLAAVDVSVIKIFENNLLYFFQSNGYNGSSELRRFGRLVYRKTVRLDGDPSVDLHEWQDFSVDLSGLCKQDPGAIYRVRLSFRKEYSLYGKDENSFSTSYDTMINTSTGELTESDIAVWDVPYAYYYGDSIDWDYYDWRETEDPTTRSYYMDSDHFDSCNIMSSNLGIITKKADDRGALVAVSDINTASPVSGAEVIAYNYQLQEIAKARTDQNGFASLKFVGGKAYLIVAKYGVATSYLRVEDGEEKSLSRFDTGGKKISDGIKGFIYGERGVWRPGDTIHLVAIIEDMVHKLPEGHPVVMEIYTPQGRYYDKQLQAGSSDGFYRFDIKTSESDPTGAWDAYIKVGGATFHKLVQVETVKPNRLKINVETTNKILLADSWETFKLGANWLTGPAASGLKAKLEMSLRRGPDSPFKNYSGYLFTNPISTFSTSDWVIFDSVLNSEGKFQKNVNMPKAADAPGILSADLLCNVFEQGGDASIWTSTVKFSPFESYVGIKLDREEYYETDKDLEFPVVIVNEEGTKVKNHEITYRIWKLDWSWWWNGTAYELDSFVNSKSHKPIVETTLNVGSGETKIPFRIEYPEYGRYLILVKDNVSGHMTGGTIYIDWPSWRGMSDKSDPNALTMLTFSTDRKEYNVGDDATLYIPKALAGSRALVSLENAAGVLGWEWVKASDKEETKYVIHITPEMAPNFFVHVTIVQPQKKCAKGTPVRLYGVQPVLVSNPASHINPVLGLPDVIRPEENFTVKVSEKDGRPMTYTLAVVDEGLLDLTNFKTPDPWSSMYARQALGVRTWDIYDNVVGAYCGNLSRMLSIGGDEYVEVGNRKENRFNPVVEFLGPFTLEKGTAKHEITLPMYVGSVRVMVVAGRNGAYGKAEKAVPVRSPLMILPTLPRQLGTAEKLTLPVNVFAMEDNIKDVKVSVTIDGPLKVSGSNSQTVKFSKSGDQIVSFPVYTTEDEGFVKVSVKAEAPGFTASDVINIEVRNPNAPEVSVTGGMIAAGETKDFEWSPFKADADNYATLELASFPSMDFKGTYNFLHDYMYDCSEQLSAKLMSFLYAGSLMGEDEAISAAIPELIKKLYSRQLPDGGFAYWPGNTIADEWVTSMAGEALLKASAKGYNVSKTVLNSWKNYEKRAVRNYRHSVNYNLRDLTQAYRLYVLALAGDADLVSMNRLRESESVSPQAMWRLAAAYAVSGKKTTAVEIINKVSEDVVECDDNECYWTALRDKAMMLETLVLADEDARSMKLAADVASEFSKGWYNTQETAFVSAAMGRLAEKVGDAAIEVELDGKSLKSASATKSYDADAKAGKLSVKNVSDSPVYASMIVRRRPESGSQVRPSSGGIRVKVAYKTISGENVNPLELSQGSDFKAEITVSNITGTTDLTNLALTFKTPSGWEVFNERLYSGNGEEESCTYKDIRDDSVIWYFDLPKARSKTFSLRCQASYEGTFAFPAVSCEAMYDASVHGNTQSSTVTVTK